MGKIIKMPDGQKVRFPDDMPDEEIKALIEDKYPNIREEAEAKRAAASGADAAASGKPSPMDQIKAQHKEMRDHPAPIIEAIVQGLDAGGGLSPEDEAAGFERNALLPRAVNKETGEVKFPVVPGVAMGAYDAFKLPGDVLAGKVDPNSDEGVAREVGFTTVFAPGAPKVAKPKLPGNTLSMVPKGAASDGIPTAAELKTIAQKSYDQAKGSEIAAVVSGKDLGGAITDVLSKEGLVRPDGKIASTFPAVKTAMKDFEAFKGKPMTFEQFQRLEEGLQTVAGSKNAGEARIGNMMLKAMDEYFAALPEAAFSKGTGSEVKAGYAGGKEGWARYSKLKRVEKAVSNAELAKGGFAEGLRSEFRTILRSESKSRGFTDEELAGMKAFVQGGKIDSIRDWLSGLRGLAGVVAGGAAAGPAGAILMPMAGAAAKGIANSGAKKTANQLRMSIAEGARPAANPGNTLSLSGPLATAGLRALGAGSSDAVARRAALRSLRHQAAAI